MNIGVFTDDYRPVKDGVVTSIETYRRALSRRGHNVYVICPAFPGFVDEDPEHIIRVPSIGVRFIPGYRFSLPSLHSIKERVEPLQLDVVHIQDPFGIGFAGLRYAHKMKIPSVHTCHTYYPEYAPCYLWFIPKSWARAAGKWIIRVVSNRIDLNIAPSTDMGREMRSYGVRNRIEVLPTGIELSKLADPHGDVFRKKYGIAENEKILLFMGRFGREKNIDFLIRAFSEIKEARSDTRLILAGDGLIRKELQKLVGKMHLDGAVMFLPYFTYTDWVNCYGAADLFVFASVTETQGLVVVEAMATGTPVVAVPIMGVTDVMEGERGCLKAELTIEDFKNKVLTLLDDRELYTRKSSEALEVAANYSCEHTTDRLLALYEDLISKKSAH
jgi:glycosyltransferase involved in cell wall biosynthesis